MIDYSKLSTIEKDMEDLFVLDPDRYKNILLITHTDLDGIGPDIVLRYIVREKFDDSCNIDTIFVDNNKMDYMIKTSVENNIRNHKYDFIAITDISCSLETGEYIQSLYDDNFDDMFPIVLLDHHATEDKLALNKFPWALVTSIAQSDSVLYRLPYIYTDAEVNDIYNKFSEPFHTCGTTLFYDYLTYGYGLETDNLIEFVKHVAYYDTWDWFNILDQSPVYKNLATLFAMYGRKVFTEVVFEYLDNPDALETNADRLPEFIYTKADLRVIDANNNKADESIEIIKYKIKSGTVMIDDKTYSICFVNTSSFLPQVFEYMRPLCDIAIINTGSQISMRTSRDDIHLGEICGKVGGGGHPGAAGIPISFNKTLSLVEDVMNAKLDLN